ncbi:hypothetical protein ACJIZ3_016998 [Penstemon smallii]|uniref:NAC domain-containing protein n=1 Tax=Penstemon smallii TaxID=265156 RepID=A0ABD3SUY3_9LAMI
MEANLQQPCSTKDDQKMVEIVKVYVLPPGARFVPKDHELIVDHLMKKVMNEPVPYLSITEIDLAKHSPQELSEIHDCNEEKEWYFYTPRDRKYRNGTRPNRAAGNGYWKATGADKSIYYGDKEVGKKKSLVYYEGKPPKGDKTNWIMHEYRTTIPNAKRTDPNDMRLDDWVLCRIYKKSNRSSKNQERTQQHQHVVAEEDIPNVSQENCTSVEFEYSNALFDNNNNNINVDDMYANPTPNVLPPLEPFNSNFGQFGAIDIPEYNNNSMYMGGGVQPPTATGVWTLCSTEPPSNSHYQFQNQIPIPTTTHLNAEEETKEVIKPADMFQDANEYSFLSTLSDLSSADFVNYIRNLDNALYNDNQILPRNER